MNQKDRNEVERLDARALDAAIQEVFGVISDTSFNFMTMDYVTTVDPEADPDIIRQATAFARGWSMGARNVADRMLDPEKRIS